MAPPSRPPYRGRYLTAIVGVAGVGALLLAFAARSGSVRGAMAAALVLLAVVPLWSAARVTANVVDLDIPPWRELVFLLLAIACVVAGLLLYRS